MTTEYRDPQQAFEDAIEAGVLSGNPAHSNYAGHYMYIWTEDGVDQFKHIDTRKYLGSDDITKLICV